MLRTEWLGRRVSVRRAVERDVTGRVLFADVVGDLVGLDADRATIETRVGRTEVPVAHIALAREVLPATAEVLALEAICARGWRAFETEEVDGWLLRADGGFTGRANSALALGKPKSLEQTLDAARAWYAARGLPFKIAVLLPARRLLDSELGDRGFRGGPEVHVLATRVDMLTDFPGDGLTVAATPDGDWFDAYHYSGQDGIPPAGRALITRHDRALFASIVQDGRTVAIGRGVVDDGWVGLTAIEVAPDRRRRGLARRVLAALVKAASDRHGATRVYVQVAATNQPAISLYLSAGFWHHHDYIYRTESAE